MDCSMPILNGYDATVEIRKLVEENRLDQPYVVACTGHVENEYILKAWKHRMDEVMPKPASSTLINEILQEVLVF